MIPPLRLVMSVVLAVLGGSGVLAACSDEEAAPGESAADASTSDASSGGTDANTPPSDGAAEDAAVEGGGDASDAATILANVALVYAGRFNNIDQRIVSAAIASDGRILGYEAGAPEAPFVITATNDAVGQDAFFAASRWADGTLGGPFNDDGGVKTLLAHEGQHLGIAKVPSVELPASGSATYTLVGATKPTLRGGSITQGAVTGGSLQVEFGGNAATRVGLTLAVAMPDGAFDLVFNGGATNVGDAGGTAGGDAGFRFTSGAIAVTGDAGATCAPDASACPTTGAARFVFSGPNAERVIVAYVFSNGSLAATRHGVAVFQRP